MPHSLTEKNKLDRVSAIRLHKSQRITTKYCEQLTKLNVEFQEKRSVLVNRKSVIFFRHNTRLHVAQQTLRKLKELKWEILQYPLYSPELAPSDFYLFRYLQNSELNG